MQRKSNARPKHGAERLPAHTPPPEIAAAIEQATGDDRRWFEEHPGQGSRIRPPVEGEFWPVMTSASVLYVIVTQVEPGHRLRVPIVRMRMPNSGVVQ